MGSAAATRLDDYENLLKKTSESPQGDTAGTAVATAALAPGAPKLMVVLTRTKLMVVLTRTYRSVADFLAGALVEKSVSWESSLCWKPSCTRGLWRSHRSPPRSRWPAPVSRESSIP